ncbi:MAG: cobalamin-dependent protein [Candidatus Omnitrophica bacterium]|nr:cobalamin-dependent protein [Candidatus Omnitrophota bacterium]
MKVLLVQPPVEDFFFTPKRAYPLGLIYLGTVLEKAGHEVRIFDFCEGSEKRTVTAPKQFGYLKRYYRRNDSAFRLFSVYSHFGKKYSEFEKELKAFSPDLAAISSNFNAYIDQALAVASRVKGADKRIVTVMGGRAVTVTPDIFLSRPEVDYILRGEGEGSLTELCGSPGNTDRGKIPGIGYRTGPGMTFISDEPAVVEDIDALPLPNRKLINSGEYTWQGEISASLITSRGCSLGCGFCAIKDRFRYREAGKVLEEIDDCYSLGVRHFNFEDDNINLNPEFEKIVDLLIPKFRGKIRVSFMNGVLASGLGIRLREKLIDLGLTHLDLSIASSVARLREEVNRTEELPEVFEAGSYFSGRNIPVTVHFIIAMPKQDFNDAAADLRLLAPEPVLLGPSIYYPAAESAMFPYLRDNYGLKGADYAFFRSSAAFYDKDIPRDRIFTLFYFCRIINFIKWYRDSTSDPSTDIAGIIEKESSRFSDKGTMLTGDNGAGREAVSLVLLKKLFAERVIYRVERSREDNRLIYRSFPEEFVAKDDVGEILSALTITGTSGRSFVLPEMNMVSTLDEKMSNGEA